MDIAQQSLEIEARPKSVPRSGRREARKRDRRETILAVATQSFLERGYAGTTMSGIAAILGGSKGTLWTYFPSKEALFGAVLDQATAAFRARIDDILDPQGDIKTALGRFCTEVLEKIIEPYSIALHRLVVAEAARFPEVGRMFQERARGATHAQLSVFIAGAMDRGMLRRDDPRDAARALTGLTLANFNQQLLTGTIDRASPAQTKADVDWTVDFFLRAYAP